MNKKTLETDREYCFLKEAVRESCGDRKGTRTVLGKLLFAALLAVVFGSIASVAFWKVQNVLEKRDARIYREKLLQSTQDEKGGQDESTSQKSDSEMIAAYENYWNRISEVGMQCNKAVVSVGQLHKESWYQKSEKTETVQSGLIFQRKGAYLYVLTQPTALVGKKTLEVEFTDGRKAEAELEAEDRNLEIAVIRIKITDISDDTMSAISAMDFTGYRKDISLDLSDRVVFFGCPNGIMRSVMLGNIVNTDLSAQVMDGTLSLYATDIGYTEGGNGFVADVEGNVVGIMTDAYRDITGENNWAFIKIEDVAAAAKAIVDRQKPVTFGIRGKDIADQNGVYVTEVEIKSPAYHGGVRVADVICAMDGCNIKSMKDLRLCLSTHERGDKVTIRLKRKNGGSQIRKTVKVELK